ncbi:MAG: isopenicillin N synthase family oxygenase [Deltaproteobacteria bacterium]|jgi:isopenicillin N synthase-like dioxygenase|nr:isopenicillin N synthase family oxygenase [Deltaproteobacteria bacterium]
MSAQSAQSIPVVDLKQFTHGDRDDQARFVSALGAALTEFGFVAVENHALDVEALAATYTELKRLLDQPREVKLRYEVPENGRQRGYTAFGLEHAKDHAVPDLKEFWHIGPELADTHPLRERIPHNVWPEDFEAFKTSSLALYASLFATGKELIRAIARFLGADEAEFMRMIDGGNTILRLIRYPAPGEVEVPEGAVWAAAHEDINLITLLPEATDPGLQLLRRDGTWLDIAPVKGQLIADTGDMMQRLTNGVIPSTTHRVLQPRHASGPRYSIPFFVHPQPDYVLSPLPQCVTADNPRRWEDITAEGYLMERIREIGLTTAQGHAGRYGKS